jgi:cytochrome c oxidase subunit 2
VGNAIAGSPVVLGDIAAHMALVADGVSGTAMQAFGDQLTAVDMAAVLTYQRNAFGNNTGDVVQPGDVAGTKNG